MLLERFGRKHSRLLVLTGARQTGKTTLVKHALPDVDYVSLEDPVVRPSYTRMSAMEWLHKHPTAVLDEVQKAPTLIETIKAAHDMDADARYVLLGSSQILLLSKVRESLAGRATILELWPLTLPEMTTDDWSEPIGESRLVQFLRTGASETGPLEGIPGTNAGYARGLQAFHRYLEFGGMPVVHDREITDTERIDWLADYQRTYLQRDVTDLANLRDLEPFVLAQRAIAGITGKQVNFSDLARLASISVGTARRFMRYLELSYQVLLIRPYFANPGKRLSKMPKVHFVDPGVLRSVINRRGDPTGEEFESAVVAEIYKQSANAGLRVDFHHLRTYDGREVDLLVECEQGFVAIEIKMAQRVSPTDARHLRDLQPFLNKPLLASLVLSMDPEVKKLASDVIAVPAAWALATAASGRRPATSHARSASGSKWTGAMRRQMSCGLCRASRS